MVIEILLKLQRRLIFANVIPLHFSFLEIWSHLLKKSLNEKFVFCAVFVVLDYNSECERNYEVLKPRILLNKKTNFNKNKTESKIENPKLSFREINLALQLI